MITPPRPPLLVVVSGPSGSGKGTALNVLAQSGFRKVVTSTTRERRPQEVDGLDYNFLSQNDFATKHLKGEFLEFNQTYRSAYYASPADLLTFDENTKPHVMELDPEGFFYLRSNSARNVVGIFTIPPTLSELETRIRHRSTTGDVETRITVARAQVMQASEYDFILENDVQSVFELQLNELASSLLADDTARRHLNSLIVTIRSEQAAPE